MIRIFFLFLLILSFSVYAQDFELKQGDEFETPGVVWYKENIESDSTGFYFLRNKNGIDKTYIYHKIDKNGKLVYLKETSFPSNGKVYNCNGKLLFFSYDDNSGNSLKTKNKKTLYLTEVDSKNGDKISETQEVDYIETKNNNQYADIDVSFSPDKKLLLITSEIKENKKVQSVICRLYSSDGYKRIWEKEPIKIYKNSTISSSEYSIDNQGNLYYIFGYVRGDHKDLNDNYDDVNYGIAASTSKNPYTELKEISANNKKIESIHVEIIENRFICNGMFSDGKIDIDKNAKRGFFMTAVNANDFSFIENFTYISSKVEDKAVILKEKNGNYINWTKGEIVILNGEYYIVRQKIYPYPPTTYDDILIVKYSKDLNFQWMRLIPKITYSPNENGLNIIMTDKLNFIYYENLKNLEKFPNTDDFIRIECIGARYDKDPVIIASINERGEITRKPLNIKDRVLLENQLIKDYHGNYLKSVVLPVRISKKKKRYDVLYLK